LICGVAFRVALEHLSVQAALNFRAAYRLGGIGRQKDRRNNVIFPTHFAAALLRALLRASLHAPRGGSCLRMRHQSSTYR
jgi:hypothetical protein